MSMISLGNFVKFYLDKMGENEQVLKIFIVLGAIALIVWVSVLVVKVLLNLYISVNDTGLKVARKKVKSDKLIEVERTKIQKELTKQKKEKLKQEKYESKRIHLELKNELKKLLVEFLKTYKDRYL